MASGARGHVVQAEEPLAVNVERSRSGMTQVFRETTTSFASITPQTGTPRGTLQFTHRRDGGMTFSIETLVNHVVSRGAERFTILPGMFPELKLVLQNPRKQAIVFDFDTEGRATVAPAVWKAFVRSGAGVVTVSRVFGQKNGMPMIRDIAAVTTSRIAGHVGKQSLHTPTYTDPWIGYFVPFGRVEELVPFGGWLGASSLHWMRLSGNPRQ